MTDFLASIGYETWILHVLIWGPLAGMIHVLAAPGERAKHLALAWSAGLFLLSTGLWWSYDPAGGGFVFVSSVPWISAWGAHYSLGLDGISLFMVILTTFMTPIAVLGAFEYVKVRRKAFYALMLLLETGVGGVFLATDSRTSWKSLGQSRGERIRVALLPGPGKRGAFSRLGLEASGWSSWSGTGVSR